ncbi:thioredoxin-like protein [Phascolomyces articulosus]|uniref:Thioredoxin-like protein n=1 Tax=Phascolomyces articulosus TaxID=60185 RepID=A0AAD5PD20_9FUNG|nr:thioredoxin-like protein [Phascolomyces articulosus]
MEWGCNRKIILYKNATSPYGHRALMALKMANVDYELVIIDMNDREWYRKEIYPEGKVPALKYGQEVIPESMVIMELIHNLYPEAKLFPANDPVKKAKMKLFVYLRTTYYLQIVNYSIIQLPRNHLIYMLRQSLTFIDAYLNGFLLEQSSTGPYFLGCEYSAVDIAIAPFVFQIRAFVKLLTDNDYRVLNELPRLREYFDTILDHPICKETGSLDEKRFMQVAVERFKVTANMFVD